MGSHLWSVVIDRGNGTETIVVPTTRDIEHVFGRIGQMVLSLDIAQIIVYRDDEEYRRYILKRPEVSE
jgi:hypothetical protein